MTATESCLLPQQHYQALHLHNTAVVTEPDIIVYNADEPNGEGTAASGSGAAPLKMFRRLLTKHDLWLFVFDYVYLIDYK